ncbi:MAG: peptidoglycan DD-metalloendopeptidase family protein [Ruminococcus sp.]|nr:peptidoglycan DD-metalloendopeptidase family protein [Ruminococcus sp.]
MEKKNIITVIITLISLVILLLANMTNKLYEEANNYYQVYLKGSKIGIIEDSDKLYDLINTNQGSIKENYGVDNVYPPTDLKIISTNTFVNDVDDVFTVYKKLEEADNFTIKGYKIDIKGEDNEYSINVLDKEVFYEAAKRFVRAFLEENDYEKYINNNQDTIVETGRIFRKMRFLEEITIKETYISVNEPIYTDELELTQVLLFGTNPDTKSYTVKLGDTIASVSESNKLNTEEFLIANPSYKSENDLLRVGDKVNVTLIEPQLTFIYDLYEVKDEDAYYQKEIVYDNTKPTSYKEITQAGQNGKNRYEEIYSVTNGVRSQEAQVTQIATIREVKNQITTVGTKKPNNGGGGIYNPVVLDGIWGWPTNMGYVITSRWGYRWGTLHAAIDISGAGNFGSNIYAAQDGTVTYVYNKCPSVGYGIRDTCGGSLGNNVIIDHGNGYYTRYGHMTNKIPVKEGQKVKKGEIIGYMGNSGSSTGTHLHFAAAQGSPTNYFDPMRLYR